LIPIGWRIETDIVGGATPPTFNAAFSLEGVATPLPGAHPVYYRSGPNRPAQLAQEAESCRLIKAPIEFRRDRRRGGLSASRRPLISRFTLERWFRLRSPALSFRSRENSKFLFGVSGLCHIRNAALLSESRIPQEPQRQKRSLQRPEQDWLVEYRPSPVPSSLFSIGRLETIITVAEGRNRLWIKSHYRSLCDLNRMIVVRSKSQALWIVVLGFGIRKRQSPNHPVHEFERHPLSSIATWRDAIVPGEKKHPNKSVLLVTCKELQAKQLDSRDTEREK